MIDPTRPRRTIDAPYVCPGCHAVGGERCAPGCIDAEIEAEHRHAIESGDYDRTDDDVDTDDEPAPDWDAAERAARRQDAEDRANWERRGS